MELQQVNAKSPELASGAEHSNGQKAKAGLQILLLIGISALTLWAYSPVFFNFFNGDDFVHLTWLSRAIHEPELVWRNFHTSWLDGTTTKFYRPLISVFMVSDYAMYGLNGLGFRITNILFHLASTVFIFLLGKQLQLKSRLANSLTWPFFAAALFALYPLHPEAVSWITGRVDSVVTPFCLASVYFYMRFSESKRISDMTLSMVAAILGLLSKEMAITLPAVFVAYELIFNVLFQTKAQASSSQEAERVSFVASLKPIFSTIPFWILLAAYFVVRVLSLGTVVGGYDDSLLFISNPKAFIIGWLHAILMFIIPLNKMLIGSHNILSKIYPAAVVASIIFASLNGLIPVKHRRAFVFLAGWLVLCLVPVYKLFNIGSDLQGSRLAYLATVPLSMLLTFGVLETGKLIKNKLASLAPVAVSSLLLVLATIVLWTNNLPWKAAGEENNAIRAELQKLYSNLDGDPEVMLLGLPDQINGAYTCRNSLDGMTKKPQLNKDIYKCLMVNGFDPIFPFGYLKESISESSDKLHIYRWDTDSKHFAAVDVSPEKQKSASQIWQGKDLSTIASLPEQKTKPEMSSNQDGSLHVIYRSAQPQFIQLDLGSRSCFNCDFVEVKLTLAQEAAAETGADILYTNDLFPDFELRRRTRAQFAPGKKEQRILFALRGLPEWSLGGNTHPFRLMLPSGTDATIQSISILTKEQVMPLVSFENSGYFGSKGFIHLSAQGKPCTINVDVSAIPGASQYAAEITRTNLLFEEQNPQVRSKVADGWHVTDKKSGQFILELSKFTEFKAPGLYEIRFFPLDSAGNICGSGSDHLAISVDPK